jgi:predicted HicB family RNase H-like nuclease
MARNSSYHFTQIEADMDPDRDNALVFNADDDNRHRSADRIMELKGYSLEVPSGQKSSTVIGQIRTPRGRLVRNCTPHGSSIEELRPQFVKYVEDLQKKVEQTFRDDLKDEKIQGKIALRISPELHCELKIEATFQDKTLNSYIEEIANQRIPFDRIHQPLEADLSSEDEKKSSVNETTEAKPKSTDSKHDRPQSTILRKLRQNPLAWSKMMSSLATLARNDESSDIVTFSAALVQFIDIMGEGVDQLSPCLDIQEGDEAKLLTALGTMLMEAASVLN